jgi:uncharacterized protein (DUF2126 family)
MKLTLNQALEPWHVMGETGRHRRHRALRRFLGRTAAGEARGQQPGPLPRHLQRPAGAAAATGENGVAVAGVRFKAWQPASGMHPALPVNAPLHFDIYDTWSGRSIGGCTYHTAHPGGRNYETFPVNGNEAEARRLARFVPSGHTPAPTPRPPRPARRSSRSPRPAAPAATFPPGRFLTKQSKVPLRFPTSQIALLPMEKRNQRQPAKKRGNSRPAATGCFPACPTR